MPKFRCYYLVIVCLCVEYSTSTAADFSPHTVNSQLLHQRKGYGVYFDHVGKITNGGGVFYWKHTWAISIPQIEFPTIETLDCKHAELKNICKQTNRAIKSTNLRVVENLIAVRVLRNDIVKLIPSTETHNVKTNKQGRKRPSTPSSTPSPNAELKKTTITTTTEGPQANIATRFTFRTPPPFSSLPKSPRLETYNTTRAESYIRPNRFMLPGLASNFGTKAAQFFCDIAGVAGPEEWKALEQHIGQAEKESFENSKRGAALFKAMNTMFVLTDARSSAIEREGLAIEEEINSTQQAMTLHAKQLGNAISTIRTRFNLTSHWISNIFGSLFPYLYNLRLQSHRFYELYMKWVRGIQTLLTGYLPIDIITPDMVREVLMALQKNISIHVGSSYHLHTTSPAYYYKIKGITFTITKRKLYIMLSIPVYDQYSLMNLYRITVYPVPVEAGLAYTLGLNEVLKGATFSKRTSDNRTYDPRTPQPTSGYTQIMSLPKYIGVTSRADHYTEMNEAMFLSCKSETGTMNLCGHASLTGIKSSNQLSCAFALFLDAHQSIKELCTIGYTKHHPHGSAIKFHNTPAFLMMSGKQDYGKHLTMSCNHNGIPMTKTFSACTMCVKDIPCGCSVKTKSGIIPSRQSDCNLKLLKGIPQITTIYTRNTAVLGNLLSARDMSHITSYEERLDKLFEPLSIPTIEFKEPDNLKMYLDTSTDIGVDLKKAIALGQRDGAMYSHLMDKASHVALTFNKAQPVDYAIKIYQEIIESLFGKTFFIVWNFIFSIKFFTCAALIFNGVMLGIVLYMYRGAYNATTDDTALLLS